MAKYRLNRKLSDGSYETVHYETTADIVKTDSGETVEAVLGTLRDLVSQAQTAASTAASAAATAQAAINSHQSDLNNPHATNYQQTASVWHAGRIGADIINNSNYGWPYIASYPFGRDIGLPGGWWHIIYFRHMDNNGHGAQLAIGLDQTLQVYVRTSIGTGWSGWAPLPTMTASTVDIGAGAALTNNQLYLVYE